MHKANKDNKYANMNSILVIDKNHNNAQYY